MFPFCAIIFPASLISMNKIPKNFSLKLRLPEKQNNNFPAFVFLCIKLNINYAQVLFAI